MTREDIIRMARECEIDCTGLNKDDFLEHFAIAVAAAERESCAKVCDAYAGEELGSVFAAAIRARGEK